METNTHIWLASQNGQAKLAYNHVNEYYPLGINPIHASSSMANQRV